MSDQKGLSGAYPYIEIYSSIKTNQQLYVSGN